MASFTETLCFLEKECCGIGFQFWFISSYSLTLSLTDLRLWHCFIYTPSVQGPVIGEMELKCRVMGCRWKVLDSCLRLFSKLDVFSADRRWSSISSSSAVPTAPEIQSGCTGCFYCSYVSAACCCSILSRGFGDMTRVCAMWRSNGPYIKKRQGNGKFLRHWANRGILCERFTLPANWINALWFELSLYSLWLLFSDGLSSFFFFLFPGI